MALAKVLKTDVMADLDLKGLAQVLASRGRHGDTMLAHITPKEARKLKREGGSGTINPDTGLPEFFEDGGGDYYDFAGSQDYQAATPETYYGSAEPYYGGGAEFQSVAGAEPAAGAGAAGGGLPTLPERAVPYAAGMGPQAAALTTGAGAQGPLQPQSIYGEPAGPPEPEKLGYFERLGTSLQKQLEDPATLARLGLGLGVGGLGLLQQQRAAAGAKQAKRETANIGAPYRAQGQELIAQAQRGEMSPASMQAYEAARAQLAQSTARQGGVGAAQGAAQLERLRTQLLQNQMSLGLSVANIGDRYLAGAIQTGQQANQQLMQATNQFYASLGNMLSGPTGQAVATFARAP